ncbi:hypothetical protein SLEP1_g37377 [Rubroshorea leprosula]|uniref:Uncharacterized protein n=1 Tax=Rubroshorea leprosula TaxID=152421 RepID=A0AAV5KUQ6_9ROSI|nr:hypothetical protein SLEP1_g37377 [Rubroshorea leprosula]
MLNILGAMIACPGQCKSGLNTLNYKGPRHMLCGICLGAAF